MSSGGGGLRVWGGVTARGPTAGTVGGEPVGGPKESRSPEEEEQMGGRRWEETLEVKVTEFSRKGSGWEGLSGGLGGGTSGACWENLREMGGGDLKAPVWPSGSLWRTLGVLGGAPEQF